MKKISLMLAILAAIGLAALPSKAMATANTKLDLIQDASAGGGELIDMIGPTGFGFINFNQNASGDLRLVVSLKGAEPDITYSGVFLVCGPTHALGCGFIDVGELTTNGQGNGNATMWLEAATLQDSPFGPGARTDHFDMIGPAGDVYAVSGIDYTVPTP
ncbi:MAG: hypothetical protein COY81_01400 [Candidatus Pacebacteria bacterium CG_4_10_14_0_8_um_filter_43_12]|nr:MAG: hypothetical protein COY81_01400 [Candidatus Pacebacteria bacterium CG_4_10_14_0_8_um_filter_43_12]